VLEPFLEIGSGTELAREVAKRGIRTPRGNRIDKKYLYRMLNNRAYIGEAVHKGESYPGEHDAIIDREAWGRVHAILQESPQKRAMRTRAETPALLKGLLFGPDGAAFSPTHTRKGDRLYRYYVSQTVLKHGASSCPVGRVPAGEIEAAVIDQLRAVFRQPEIVAGTWKAARGLADDITEADGPKRSGKGTIARVLAGLLGTGNVAAPTLAALASNFGLAPLIGRRLAIISDARLGSRADQAAIGERLLSSSGEDAITIDRKHKDAWTGRLDARFMVLTNELPKFGDASGALASRFIVLTLQRSFFGREDHALTDRLLVELPGILNWSLLGLARLRDRGHFEQPESSAEAIRDLEDLGSPISAFIRDKCHVEPGAEVECGRLFGLWKDWCADQGRAHPGTAQSFARDLKAAVPGISTGDRRKGGERWRVYVGIGA